jgi:hypothetical protein
MRSAALLLGVLLAPNAATTTLSYETPAGWSRTEDPKTGTVTLSPGDVPKGGVCGVLIFPPQAESRTADAFHEDVLRQVASSGRLLEAKDAGSLGGFRVSVLRVQMPNGIPFTYRVYSARWADRGQAIGLSASSSEIADRYAPAVDAMISKTSVPGASVARATPSASATAVAAKGALSGVYLTLKASGGFNYGVSKDYIVFFPDGSAFWHLPAEGLLDFDAAASQKESPDFWGRWEMKGDAIAIHWTTGPQYSGKRQRNGTLLLNGSTYVLQTSGADGQTLNGTYRPENTATSDCCDVTFHDDGTFEDRGVRTVAGVLDLSYGRSKVPTGPGRGRYRIAQSSIVFEYADGRREQLSFYIPGADGSRTPGLIVINTFSIVRRP